MDQLKNVSSWTSQFLKRLLKAELNSLKPKWMDEKALEYFEYSWKFNPFKS